MSAFGAKRFKAMMPKAGSLEVSGDLLPSGDGGGSLGNSIVAGDASDVRWSNLSTQDLHLSNDRGSYTIIEEENYLSIRNHKNGKLYKFVLEEIETQAVDIVEEIHHIEEPPETQAVDIVEEIHHIEEPPSAQPLVWTFATAQTRDSWTHARAKKRDPWTHARSQIS